ncbi:MULTISPECIES: hypothetical protein [unclassified Cupriavidus]|uniref:hypothetical protein n=1 Tax=unclassified Cupriavidus TaxID=2640874 RepID=UPI001CED088B|nr:MULTISPECIES: hypothetical protein [unclassified Cupriavidus]MCA3185992.1 hypothetical protein [Cupriavidus sp.]MCA3193397.1 hypothetical protein [Cupriavidus sp.]MCA3198199.1 hypothetical protein [Cupriavidus sp.]MCA3204966.1 hypothetical protein [Cupriavidus sp.]MCA3208583.1 hypothetical protein [Cupriavidus sp.]
MSEGTRIHRDRTAWHAALSFGGAGTPDIHSDASEEEVRTAIRDIELAGRLREQARHQSFRDQVNCAMIGMFWILCASLAGGIVVYSWHLMTPLLWHFLDDAQQVRLQTLLAPAVLSSSLTGYVSRRIE